MTLWFAFNKRSLTTHNGNKTTTKVVVICFQQTIFDNLVASSQVICISCDLLSTNDLWQPLKGFPLPFLVVICFQQTIFDNSFQDAFCLMWVVICFQQTIFDNKCKQMEGVFSVVICFQQTIFDNSNRFRNWFREVVICFSTNDLWQRSLSIHRAVASCDLLSTNDLWQPFRRLNGQ